jgi:hypothetical protein
MKSHQHPVGVCLMSLALAGLWVDVPDARSGERGERERIVDLAVVRVRRAGAAASRSVTSF